MKISSITLREVFLIYSGLSFLFFLFMAGDISAQTGEWINCGPPGYTLDIAVNPLDSSEMFVSVPISGLFKSTDCGRTWKFSAKGIPVSENLFHYYYGLVKYNPVNPQIIYAGTGHDETGCGMGAYKSTDGGNNWERMGRDSIPASASILSIEINPLNTNRMYLSAINCNGYDGIYRSDDAGTTWQKILRLDRAGPLLIDKKDTSIIYSVDGDGTFYKSNNGGDTWEGHSNDVMYGVRNMIRSEATGEFFITTMYRGMFKSPDGIHIVSINNNLPPIFGSNVAYDDIAFNYDSSAIFIAASDSGLYMTTDYGKSWVNKFNEVSVREIEIYADSILIGTSAGLFSSKDDGDNWNYIGGGYGSSYVTSIANAPGSPDILYASTYSGIFKSKDKGFTWERAGHTGKFVQKVAVHPNNPDIVYAGCKWIPGYRGLYKSTNGGETWFNISPQADIDVNEIEIQYSEPNIILTGLNNVIWKSTDEGTSWDTLYTNPGAGDFKNALVCQLKIAQSNPDIIYASFTADHYDYFGIYISTDGGKSWKRKVNGFPSSLEYSRIYSLVVHPSDPRLAYAGNSMGEVYRTINTGNNWLKVKGGLPNSEIVTTSITIDKERPSVIYITFSGGVIGSQDRGIYRSTDNGMNWKKHSLEGMYNALVTCFLSNSSGYAEDIYAGTEYGGIFKYYEDNALPAEFSSFNASCTGNMKVELVWTTASEKNNLGFSIERRNQNLSWTEIGFIPGKGTTAEESKYYFEDHLTSPGYYTYRLKQIDMDGSAKYVAEKEVQVSQLSKFALEQNFPNPFNPQTTIEFNLPEDGFVTLKLYDPSGAETSTLINEYRQASEYSFNLSSRDLASGVYIYKIDINTSTGKKYSSARKLTVLK